MNLRIYLDNKLILDRQTTLDYILECEMGIRALLLAAQETLRPCVVLVDYENVTRILGRV